MKKIIALSLVLSALAAAVTGCSNNSTSSSESSDVSSSVSSEESSSSEVVSDDAASEDEASDSTDSSESSDDSSTAAESRAEEYANIVMNAIEWPSMGVKTDAEDVQLAFSIDTSLCEDYYFADNMMSVHFNRILIAKPSAGNEEALKAQFDSYASYLDNMETDRLYEDQVISLSGRVHGETPDGYYYIIVHEDGAAAEAAMLAE